MDNKTKIKLKEIIKDSFEHNRNQIPWNGMHDEAVEKIEKLFEDKIKKSREKA